MLLQCGAATQRSASFMHSMVVLETTHGGIRPDPSSHTAAPAPAPPRNNTLLHPLQSHTHDAHTQKQLKHGCTFAAEYSLL